MNGIIRVIILSGLFVISTHVLAGQDNSTTTTPATTNANATPPTATHSGMWLCTTNASSATSGSPDEQADQQMSKNAAQGKSAFDFALKNCRDCTKITCELQTKPAE